ncbi:NUDIX domain-containing protein [Clostridium sp. 'deep sea']|uniref:NUDIX hydrolase n=1 Tax=Clostridium sp. 'deep sea' TaxID=2779445 RepID=UPI0018967FF4|nr:NUDIX domain-containing protein [Clostridium sp. 'deep sea']QOR34176.1 NUDIX domain-containing protein [Clostridium sp. 'deep sea']
METFAIPAVGGIIERIIKNEKYILIQDRVKQEPHCIQGMVEIAAGKVRAFENVYNCLRREVFEETGLNVISIKDEDKAEIYEIDNYKVVNYQPFSCSQNTKGDYPIMVEVFICRATGQLLNSTNEACNFRWVSLEQLKRMLIFNTDMFYAMHVSTLRKYCNSLSI